MKRNRPSDRIRSAAVFGSLVCLIGLSAILEAPAQINDPNHPIPDYVRRAAEDRAKNNPSFNDLMNKVGLGGNRTRGGRRRGMSAEDRKRIEALMTPDEADVARYREFLKQDDTGIIRLYPDFDCGSKGLVSVAGNCANQVHMGSVFSFRDSNYFTDIRYNNGRLTGNGFFSHEILADLGDIPLESVGLQSPGIEWLNTYSPANDFSTANKQFREIVSGIEAGGIRYSRSIEPKADTTYAIRIVAFDSKASLENRMYRRTRREPLVWSFRSVQLDKRIDVIVAFRVVRMGDDGNVTVVWKRLSRKKAPTIKFDKKEPLQIFQ